MTQVCLRARRGQSVGSPMRHYRPNGQVRDLSVDPCARAHYRRSDVLRRRPVPIG
jgi:hypothetical protein